MSAPDFDADKLEALDNAGERGYMLQFYIDTAATMMSTDAEHAERIQREMMERRDRHSFAALVLSQAILDSADACSARLERIADTLDDLVEAIERKTEGGEVSPY